MESLRGVGVDFMELYGLDIKMRYRVSTYIGWNEWWRVEYRYWWFPFWLSTGNLYATKEEAIAAVRFLQTPSEIIK